MSNQNQLSNEPIKYNEDLSYKIVDNGYEIYINGQLVITQYDQYSHVYKADGTFEENCMIQLKELEEMKKAQEEKQAIDIEEK